MAKEIKINWKDEIYTVLVDDDAYPMLSRHTWYIMFSGDEKNPYAFLEVYSKGKGKRMVYMHQIVTGSFGQTDHINLNTLDNQFGNLRPATHQENGWNKGKNRACRHGMPTSQYKGVSKIKGKSLWRAIIKTTAKGVKPAHHVRLGPFKSEIEAAQAYNEEIVKWRGKWAWVNPIPEINHHA